MTAVALKNDVALAQDCELWMLFHQTCDAIIKARENALRKQIGISRMQASVLFIVNAIDGPATPAEISRWLFREPHSVSGLLNRMEKDGLIKKVKDLERKNLIRVAITEKGEEAYRRSWDVTVVPEIMSSLSRKKRENLRAYLEILRNRALEELRDEHHRFPYP
jgi:DNA-binding MarR family transcriptional regulator